MLMVKLLFSRTLRFRKGYFGNYLTPRFLFLFLSSSPSFIASEKSKERRRETNLKALCDFLPLPPFPLFDLDLDLVLETNVVEGDEFLGDFSSCSTFNN